jgi:hypothetical protein
MRLDDFIELCKRRMFVDYDGFGELATETQVSDQVIYPSYIERGPIIDPQFTHIVWYNK